MTTILHLSDIQLGPNHRFGRPSALADSIIEDFNESVWIAHPELRPDLVVVTGDLTESATRQQFADAFSQLDMLSDAFTKPDGSRLGRARVLAVPGNHDVHWNDCAHNWKELEEEGESPTAEKCWRKWQRRVRPIGRAT